MSVQGRPQVISNAPARGLAAFAEPEWRGAADEGGEEAVLRPFRRIEEQIQRLSAWVAAGASYGWLGAYQARRSAFELQSIRAQIVHETARNGGRLADGGRRAVQSRLDRLELCLEAARQASHLRAGLG